MRIQRHVWKTVFALILVTQPKTPSVAQTSIDGIECGQAYTVQQGDTLTSVASKVSGSARQVTFQDIFQANEETIVDANSISVGSELDIPCSGEVKSADQDEPECERLGLTRGSRMPEIDQELCTRFDKAADDPDHMEQVIVTLKPDADRAELRNLGMSVVSEMRNQPITTGAITAATLKELSEWDGVVRVELDASDMRALGN